MSVPPRTVLLALAVLLAAGFALWMVSDPGNGGSEDEIDPGRIDRPTASTDGSTGPASPSGTTPEGPLTPAPPENPITGPGGNASDLVGERTPEGIDLTEHRQAMEHLEILLDKEPSDWKAIRRLLAVVKAPIDPALRRRLLQGLEGTRRGLVREALAMSNDPQLGTDLLALFDDPESEPQLKSSILSILGRLPSEDSASIVVALESRLSGAVGQDVPLLRAIAARGGKEGGRAIVDYLERAPDPLRLRRRDGLGLDLVNDKEAAEVFASALRSATSPALTQALAEMVASPGAEVFVESLASLDHDESSPEVRRVALGALGEIGTESAVDHLLKATAREDGLRDAAWQSIGEMNAADEKAREKLMSAYEAIDERQSPPAAKRALLRALSNLGHAPAAPAFGEALRDSDPTTREIAVLGLGRTGEAGRPYVDALVETYGASSTRVKRSVIQALGGIGGPEARSVLQQMKSSGSLDVSLQRAIKVALNRFPKPEDEKESDTALGGR